MKKAKDQAPEKGKAYYAQMLQALRVDYETKLEMPPVMLTARGIPIGRVGSYVNICGKEKNGKSVITSAIVASAFAPDEVFNLKLIPLSDRPKVLYFDTEQDEGEVRETGEQMKGFMLKKVMPSNLVAYRLKVANNSEIRPLIEAAMEWHPDASVIVIDGLLDMTSNFNDEQQARDIIDWIRYITDTFKILVIGVIHQSKSTGMTMGHLGSASNRLASNVIQVEKDEEDVITVSPHAMRRRSFKDISIFHNGERFIEKVISLEDEKRKKNDKGPHSLNIPEHRNLILRVMPEDGLMYDDLITATRERQGVSIKDSQKFVKYWMDEGLIFQQSDKKWNIVIDTKIFPMSGSK